MEGSGKRSFNMTLNFSSKSYKSLTTGDDPQRNPELPIVPMMINVFWLRFYKVNLSFHTLTAKQLLVLAKKGEEKPPQIV